MTTKTTMGKQSVAKEFFTFKRDFEYYGERKARKVADFFIGLGVSLIGILLYIPLTLIGGSMQYGSGMSMVLGGVAMLISGVSSLLWIVALVFAIIGRRKYLVMGLLVIPALFLLFFGACLLVLGGSGLMGSNQSMSIIGIIIMLAVAAGIIFGVIKAVRKK